MKICLAQTKPITGDIQKNIESHKTFIERAVSQSADAIIFPELSLTGYEPTLAQALAIQPEDARLDEFQTMANAGEIIICVGAPTQNQPRPCISLIIIRPYQARQIYSKQYLHPHEKPFFVNGQQSVGLMGDKNKVALAICYEISVPEHAENASKNRASIYIASVAKFVNGIEKAHRRLSDIANQFCLTVFMANCVRLADGAECAGQSAVWNSNGRLIGQLDDKNEGILVYDTQTGELVADQFQHSPL